MGVTIANEGVIKLRSVSFNAATRRVGSGGRRQTGSLGKCQSLLWSSTQGTRTQHKGSQAFKEDCRTLGHSPQGGFLLTTNQRRRRGRQDQNSKKGPKVIPLK